MSFTAASFSARTTSAIGTRHLFVALLSIWSVVLLGIFVEGNDFPAAWHWDEPSKVAQIQGDPFNFHHPLLMLDATRLLLAFQVHPTAAQIIVAGRWVSALAAVAAVDLLAILAMLLQGEIAGLLTALLVGTNPMVFGLAHYMKEDTVYVFGLSAFLLALVRYDGKPDASRLVQLAIASGIAASSKYIGLVTVPVALGALAWRV